MLAEVVSDPIEVAGQLAALGLSEEVLRTAVKMGEAARAECTPNDPRSFPGQTAWARTVRGLRDQLAPQGWRRNDSNNFPTVVSPDGATRIAVATGDENVGRDAVDPKTKSAKGPIMESAIERNFMQYAFPFAEELQADAPSGSPARNDWRTWVLLFHATDREVRCELSLPAGFDESGRVEAWKTRILLTSIELDPTPRLNEEDLGADIEVPVVRRSP